MNTLNWHFLEFEAIIAKVIKDRSGVVSEVFPIIY
jgi:hypothetical protein